MGAENIQLGIGDLSLKGYVAGSYSSGFASPGWHSEKGMVFTAKSSDKKIKVGNKLGVVKTFFIDEEFDMEGAIQELTAVNIARALGLADADVSDDVVNHIKSFYVGGNTTNNYFSAQFKSPWDVTGLYLQLTLFKCLFARDLKLEMKPGDAMDVPIKLAAQVDDAAGVTNGKSALVEFKYQA